MAEILSQSQIDELLNNLSSGDVDIKEIEANEKKVKEYDFRSLKKITKETIKLLKGIYEGYCRMLSSRLTSMLRLMCDVTVEQVEESIFHEYNNALDDYVLMGLVNVGYPDDSVSDSQILMDISKPLSFVIIDRLLGGSGEEYENLRDYTDIELSLLGNMLKQVVPMMGVSWESTIELKTELAKIETNSRFIQSINYNDTVVIVVLNVALNESTGKITICIPSSIIGEVMKKANVFSKTNKKKMDQSVEEQKEIIMDSIKTSKLAITGVLGKAQATLKDIVDMQVGDLIILDKAVNSYVDVNVDGEKWFEGTWGTKKNKGVIKIKNIIR
ncbi:flagellar motor switch protein FliM [Sedimentibacter saalensis]|uniref:Flagellar motor switch protein FliM n=1 Tax=Sedimentibacter saalensis TaxID=130788 RepID=A0A562J6L3_9FIRM|nr:flagellar motor switch protein FliM [Sedimentibacter saalensis]TWH78733.1 flagellar motor switch protein FliM [Sedimentibacter saalensis]